MKGAEYCNDYYSVTAPFCQVQFFFLEEIYGKTYCCYRYHC